LRPDRKRIHRVRLIVDLSDIDKRCKMHATGYSDPKAWVKKAPLKGRKPTDFVWVGFDNGASLMILWGMLEKMTLDGRWAHD
jgi:hypothetical protein